MRIEDEVMGLLSSREVWTGRALADALGVSLRTVRRALVRLEAQGVSLETEVGRGGGVRLVGTGLHRLKLDHREAIDLLLALAIAESMGSPLLLKNVRALRARLGAAFPPQQRRVISRLRTRVFVGAPASVRVASTWRAPRPRVVTVLQDAFFARRCLNVEYVDRAGQRTRREVEPHALLLNAPVWYLLGWDRLRGAGRIFRLDAMEAASALALGFAERAPETLMDDLERFFRPL
ncbi:MAG: WYL domain-containing protein [Myxococcaceae bacterium]|nr:WYL domain-containing protein [Myxococcaceae bacterium]